ncbi:apolipoprotein C-II [Centropristis striata]|uniref:apolipoprotein C-II n=1 Tax=Centropristis striata TaxID=184440 RepID=UPI0027E00CD5|nr:apolipoprotein C-II [Centropristis striata]
MTMSHPSGWSEVSFKCLLFSLHTDTSDTMNKLLVITVLVALLALSAESFRVPRQVDEEQGTMTKITDTVKNAYASAVDTVSGYVESIKGLKLEEKIKNVYSETTSIMGTYAGIMQDQMYHIFYQK